MTTLGIGLADCCVAFISLSLLSMQRALFSISRLCSLFILAAMFSFTYSGLYKMVEMYVLLCEFCCRK